jgi:TRAP-type C4-dicarboxylate transport system permease large subunit
MVACKIAGIEYNKTFGMLLPYTAAWVVVVILVAFNPWMVTWLPSMMIK